jgi:hypothetical protein
MTPGAGPRAARVVLACAWLFAAPLAAPASAQPPADPPHRWQIEVVGAQALLGPADLDALVDYETAIVNHLRTQQVQQTHEGDLRSLDRAYPIGARVIRTTGGRLSLGAGFSWLSTSRRSSAKASYSYTVVDPTAQEYQRTFSEVITTDPLALTAREYFAHAVVRYDWIARPRLRLGTSLHAGWLIANCRIERARTTAGGFYPASRVSRIDMDGRGNGPAADALLTARVAVTRRLGLLAEAGYGWHEARKVTGTSTTTTVVQDGEAAEVELEQTVRAEGRWTNQAATYQTGSGLYRGTVPVVGGQGSPFSLSLSGWRFRLGVSVGL